MDKNVILEILTRIKNKIQESSFVNYSKDIRHNISNRLEANIDILKKKIQDPKNYIEAKAQDYEEIIEEYLDDIKDERRRNEEELTKIDFRIKNLQDNISAYKKILKDLEKKLSGNTKSNKKSVKQDSEEAKLAKYNSSMEDLSKLSDLFDEQQRYDNYSEELKHTEDALKAYKDKKDKLVKRNAELDKNITKYTNIVNNFSLARENAIDDVEMRRDDHELAIYEDSLSRYKSLESAFTNSYQKEVEDLINNYSNDAITFEELKERLLLVNEKLNVQIDLEDRKDLISYGKDLLETLKLKVSNKRSYESKSKVTTEDSAILKYLKDRMMESQSELSYYRRGLETINDQLSFLDDQIRVIENKSKQLEGKMGRFVSTVEDQREEEIKKQNEVFASDVQYYKSLKKEYLKEKKQIEKNIVSAMEANEKYETLYNSRENELKERTILNVYEKEMDMDKVKDLESCLLILGFNTDMIDVSIDKEIEEINSYKVDNEKKENTPLYDNNGNEIPSFLKDELEKEEQEETKQQESEGVSIETPEIKQEVQDTQKIPSFVYEQLAKEEQQESDLSQEIVEEPVIGESTDNKNVEINEEELKELTESDIKNLVALLNKNSTNEVTQSIDDMNTTEESTFAKEIEPSSNELNTLNINLGDEDISFEETNSEEYKKIDGNEFTDDGVIHESLARKVRSNESINALNSFFAEQESLLNEEEEITEHPNDEITVDNNGEEYSFDLGTPEKEEQPLVENKSLSEELPVQNEQEELKELTVDELENLRRELLKNEEYEGGTYGK